MCTINKSGHNEKSLEDYLMILVYTHDNRIYMDGERTKTLFYRNITLTLYSQKGLNLWCVRDGRGQGLDKTDCCTDQ